MEAAMTDTRRVTSALRDRAVCPSYTGASPFPSQTAFHPPERRQASSQAHACQGNLADQEQSDLPVKQESRGSFTESERVGIGTKDPMLVTSEVAEILRIAERTVRYWAEIGWLRGFKVGKEWRFRKSVIESYLTQHEEKEGLED